MASVDRTFSICDRATELMRTYCESASPHSYELWYTYVTGIRPSLNEAMKSGLTERRKLTAKDVEELHSVHVADDRLTVSLDEAGGQISTQVEKVMTFLDTALGSAAKYDASLTALSADLDLPGDKADLRKTLEALLSATREVASTNRTLESQLRDSQGEIGTLRHTLDAVRVESLTDPLTGIANRKRFETTLADATEHARTSGDPLSLIIIDIDHFKRFNDTYGHLTGDQVLRLVSAAMREHVDPTVTLARFGGEEFGMILPGFGRAQAVSCAETVRRSVESRELLKLTTGESLGRVTVSLGVAVLHAGETATSLLDRADQCMYQAKSTGRNRTLSDADRGVTPATNRAA